MTAVDDGCGPLHRLYVAAQSDDIDRMHAVWRKIDPGETDLRADSLEQLEAAVAEGDTALARELASDILYREDASQKLDGPATTLLGSLLYAFGYVASFVLFFRAHSQETVVARLRWAYRTVGVDIQDTETVDDVERTTFRCPYRNIGADRWGQRHACHDVLDRVDDGYVTFLERHRDIDYQRPRACAASECCYSEVSGL